MKLVFFLLFSFIVYAQNFDIYTGNYTGSGGDDSTIVVNGGTDLTASGKHALVIVKGAVAQYAVWRGSAHVGDVSSRFYNIADGANAIQAFNSTGFQIGTDATVNTKDAAYYYIVMLADTSLMYCTTYAGNGTGQNVSVPISDIGMAWIKRTTAIIGCWRTNVFGTDSTALFSGNVITDGINAFGSGTVNVEVNLCVNESAGSYYLVVFKNAPFLAAFRYVGTGVDNLEISFGKTLTNTAFCFNCRETNASSNTFTTTELNSDKTLLVLNNATVFTNMLQSFTNSSVNIGSHGLINTIDVRYYMFAVGDYQTPAAEGINIYSNNFTGFPEFPDFINDEAIQ